MTQQFGSRLDSAIEVPAHPMPPETPQPTLALARLLWARRRFLARVALRTLIICALVSFLIPNRYESTARIMPPDQQNQTGVSMLLGVLGSTGLGASASDLLGFQGTGELFVGILQSERVQERLVQRFDLRRVYWVRLNVDARSKLASNTNISVDRKSGIISVSVRDRDPKRAAALAQAYISELNRTVAEVSTSSARRERIFLEQRLQTVKQELDKAAQAFSQFASKNTAIDVPQQGKAMLDAAARLQGELVAAQSQLSGLEQIYTANNVRVRSLRARVSELKRRLDQLAGTSADGASSYPSIRELPALGVTWGDLYRQTKIEEAVYEILTKQYELAKVQEAKEIPTVRVLDTPTVPEKKVFPPRLLMVSLATVLAFCLAGVWVVASDHWQALPADRGWKGFLSNAGGTGGRGRSALWWVITPYLKVEHGVLRAVAWTGDRLRRGRKRPAHAEEVASQLEQHDE